MKLQKTLKKLLKDKSPGKRNSKSQVNETSRVKRKRRSFSKSPAKQQKTSLIQTKHANIGEYKCRIKKSEKKAQLSAETKLRAERNFELEERRQNRQKWKKIYPPLCPFPFSLSITRRRFFCLVVLEPRSLLLLLC